MACRAPRRSALLASRPPVDRFQYFMALEGCFFAENLGPAEPAAMLATQMDAEARQRIADFASIGLFLAPNTFG